MKVLFGNCWLWIVGKWVSAETWKIRGIYSDKSLAEKQRLDAEHFIAPLMCDVPLPPEMHMHLLSAISMETPE